MGEITARLGGAGIGVSDLRRSTDFYINVFGFSKLMKFTLPDMDEIIVGNAGKGTAIVLMCHHEGERDLADTGGKLVFYVSDPATVAARAVEHGAELIREPTPVAELGDALVGFVTDPDGHLIELLQA